MKRAMTPDPIPEISFYFQICGPKMKASVFWPFIDWCHLSVFPQSRRHFPLNRILWRSGNGIRLKAEENGTVRHLIIVDNSRRWRGTRRQNSTCFHFLSGAISFSLLMKNSFQPAHHCHLLIKL